MESNRQASNIVTFSRRLLQVSASQSWLMLLRFSVHHGRKLIRAQTHIVTHDESIMGIAFGPQLEYTHGTLCRAPHLCCVSSLLITDRRNRFVSKRDPSSTGGGVVIQRKIPLLPVCMPVRSSCSAVVKSQGQVMKKLRESSGQQNVHRLRQDFIVSSDQLKFGLLYPLAQSRTHAPLVECKQGLGVLLSDSEPRGNGNDSKQSSSLHAVVRGTRLFENVNKHGCHLRRDGQPDLQHLASRSWQRRERKDVDVCSDAPGVLSSSRLGELRRRENVRAASDIARLAFVVNSTQSLNSRRGHRPSVLICCSIVVAP